MHISNALSYYQSTAKDTITYSVCADSASGQATLSVLNIFYADSQHNRDVEYDWCGQAGCGASSDTGLILGLILGAVGLGVIIAIFIYCTARQILTAVIFVFLLKASFPENNLNMMMLCSLVHANGF